MESSNKTQWEKFLKEKFPKNKEIVNYFSYKENIENPIDQELLESDINPIMDEIKNYMNQIQLLESKRSDDANLIIIQKQIKKPIKIL